MYKPFPFARKERQIMLYQVLRGKTKHISDVTLKHCVQNLNVNRLYVVKSTDSPEKFQNIATSEIIASKSRKVLSSVTVLYGDYTPGCYHETPSGKNYIAGSLKKGHPAIALKRSVYNVGSGISKTYTIVIYDCA